MNKRDLAIIGITLLVGYTLIKTQFGNNLVDVTPTYFR